MRHDTSPIAAKNTLAINAKLGTRLLVCSNALAINAIDAITGAMPPKIHHGMRGAVSLVRAERGAAERFPVVDAGNTTSSCGSLNGGGSRKRMEQGGPRVPIVAREDSRGNAVLPIGHQ